ncbi:MAG: aminotransferase class III-fold pyridoxal phosphate-dependent enzyme [Bifidobacteriaceae bacterium]|jgi:adenosylmethionine-8-amino-7-oxononanoate aminotransferase|nr:aminotransferase class III-fold pyridoxal phosphate-dependent enzyme [Bifidobacteriaceae bacterium]
MSHTDNSSIQFLNPPSSYTPCSQMPVAAKDFTVTYADGRQALCGTSGVWNVSLGYGNRAIARAVHDATLNASYLGQFRTSHVYAERAADLLLHQPAHRFDRVLFATSGSAAVDASIKVARTAAALRGQEHRGIIVSIKGSYHGMTLAAMSAAGQDLGQRLAGARQDATRTVGHDDVQGFTRLVDSLGPRIAAVIVEPVLGSGTLPVSSELIAEICRRRDTDGYVLIADEVATGFGRTGPMFASDLWPAAPDLLIASKALTNGTVAASAIMWSPALVNLYEQTDLPLYHAETQAGTPASCAAIMATIEEYHRLKALEQAARTAQTLDDWLDGITRELPGSSATGRGCFRSLHLRSSNGEELTGQEVMALTEMSRQAGATVYPGPSCLQLVPALTYDCAQLNRLLETVGEIVTSRLALVPQAA